MNKAIGVKEILYKPMTKGEYNEYRGWDLPENEDGDEKGYLVEYQDSKSNHKNHKGYISWSPKDVFEASYTEFNLNTNGKVTLQPFQQRVVEERAGVISRLVALINFLEKPTAPLSLDQMADMQKQVMAMKAYANILSVRIGKFK
jgi:hypothetical protein